MSILNKDTAADNSTMTKEEASDSIEGSNDVLHNLELTAKINEAINKHLSLNRKHELSGVTSGVMPIIEISAKQESVVTAPRVLVTDSSSMLIDRSRKVFAKENHFYPKVVNAKIHPLVASFFKLGNESIMARYKQMNPAVNVDILRSFLAYKPKYFKWAGKWSESSAFFFLLLCF